MFLNHGPLKFEGVDVGYWGGSTANLIPIFNIFFCNWLFVAQRLNFTVYILNHPVCSYA